MKLGQSPKLLKNIVSCGVVEGTASDVFQRGGARCCGDTNRLAPEDMYDREEDWLE